jgi:valyl-tRNA synthetase
LLIPLGDLVDLQKEAQRAMKDYGNMLQEIARSEDKLCNQGFLAKAPQAMVDQERLKLEENRVMLDKFKNRVDELND